jgi:hypothetical protein
MTQKIVPNIWFDRNAGEAGRRAAVQAGRLPAHARHEEADHRRLLIRLSILIE